VLYGRLKWVRESYVFVTSIPENAFDYGAYYKGVSRKVKPGHATFGSPEARNSGKGEDCIWIVEPYIGR
jgi:hypothetical protein